MTGKGGKVTITAAGHINERAVHVHAGALIGYMWQVRGALFGDINPLYDMNDGKNIRGVIIHEHQRGRGRPSPPPGWRSAAAAGPPGWGSRPGRAARP